MIIIIIILFKKLIGKRYSLNETGNFQKNVRDVILDLVPDEKEAIQSKRQTTKWDRKKKKFVQVTGNVDINKMSRNKRVRNESGQLVNSTHKTNLFVFPIIILNR